MWSQNIDLLVPQSQSSAEQETDVYATSGRILSTQACSSQSTCPESATFEETPAESQGPLRFLDAMMKRASELEDPGMLTTGSKSMDKFLHGGIPCFGITEIYGESASAKTQLCLQLALLAQLPPELGGLNAGTVYINTEGCAFPNKRMAELAGHFAQKYNFKEYNPMDSVIVEVALDHDSLFACLFQKVPALISGGSKIRLVIIDSIAAVYRSDYTNDNEGMEERTKNIRRVGRLLHDLSRDLKAAVVVVNQVTSSVSAGHNIPSLGLVWTNLVTTRLHLVRRNNDRYVEVIYAPHIPPGSKKFCLSQEGISSEGPTQV